MTYIIGIESCNGEEKGFVKWLHEINPELNIEIKNTDLTGLFDENNDRVNEGQYFGFYPWDKYCKSL